MTDEDRLRTLEEKVARIEAREEILALKHRYLRACDGKDPQGFRDAFISSGAVIDYAPLGRFDDADGIAAVYNAIAMEKVDDAYVVLDMHHGLHPDITLTGPETAEGRWTLRFRQVNRRERMETVTAVEYEDAYAVENGEWKISACASTTLWSITRPLADTVEVVDHR